MEAEEARWSLSKTSVRLEEQYITVLTNDEKGEPRHPGVCSELLFSLFIWRLMFIWTLPQTSMEHVTWVKDNLKGKSRENLISSYWCLHLSQFSQRPWSSWQKCPTKKVKAKKFENPKVFLKKNSVGGWGSRSEMITSKMLVGHNFHVSHVIFIGKNQRLI